MKYSAQSLPPIQVPDHTKEQLCDWLWIESPSSLGQLELFQIPHTREELEKVFQLACDAEDFQNKETVLSFIADLWYTDALIFLDNWIIWSWDAKRIFQELCVIISSVEPELSTRYNWRAQLKYEVYDVRLRQPDYLRTHKWVVLIVGEDQEILKYSINLQKKFFRKNGYLQSKPILVSNSKILICRRPLFEIVQFISETFYILKFRLVREKLVLEFYGELHLRSTAVNNES